MTSGRWAARTVPSSGIVTWNSASSSSRDPSNSSSAHSIPSIEQDRGARSRRVDRLQQGSFDQEGFAVQLVACGGTVELAGGFEDAQLDELSCVVPLIHRVRDVEAFVALQPDEIGLERCRDRGCQRGLADARLSFEKQRPAEPEGEEDGDGQAVVGHVMLRGQTLLEVLMEPRQIVCTLGAGA